MPRTKYVRWLLWGWWVDGICVPPLGIYIKRKFKDDDALLAHELGHWSQYREWGFWKFWWTVARCYIDGRQDSDFIERDADRRAGL
jgi:hypothetical protein